MRFPSTFRMAPPALAAALLAASAAAQADLDLERRGSLGGAAPFLHDTPQGVWGVTGAQSEYAIVAVRQNPRVANDYGLAFVRLQNPGAPVVCRFFSFQNNLTIDKNAHDVAVSGNLLFATAHQSGQPAGDGLVVVPLTGETGTPPCLALGSSIVVPDLPNGKNLAVWDEGAVRTVYVTNSTREVTCVPSNLGLYLYRVSPSPLVAVRLAQWRPDMDAFLDDTCAPCDSLCAPEAVTVAERGGRRLAFVATFKNGIHVVDVTNPSAPVTAAHFIYTWSQGDRDRDGAPDFCDVTGDGVPDDLDGDLVADDFCPTRTLDVALSEDGEVLYTTDQFRWGGHLIAWRVQDILDACSDPLAPCAPDDPRVPKRFEYRASTLLPRSLGSLVRQGPFLYVSAFDDGVRILDTTEPENPREIARHDTLPDHPAGALDGVLGAYDVFPGRSYLLATDIGAYDPGSPPAWPPLEGGLHVLRYTGGPGPARELRVSKRTMPSPDGTLDLAWGPVPFGETWHAYRGLVLAFRSEPDNYNHRTVAGGCDLVSRAVALPAQYVPGTGDPLSSAYYLVVAENARGERGHAGRDSAGAVRVPPNPECP